MKYKIVCDSSSNLRSDYLKEEDIGFGIAPLSILINNKEYIDDDNVDTKEVLKEMKSSKTKSSTSCPTPYSYLENFNDKDNYTICITISSKLSGSYNSAINAKNMTDNPDNIFVLDSKSAAGGLQILVDYAVSLIKQGYPFNEIKERLITKRNEINILFVLDNYDNLVKNGRMNKVVAMIATMIAIKPLCMAEDGEIKIKEKIRTLNGVIKRLVFNIGKLSTQNKEKTIIISHTNNLVAANYIKDLIKETYNFKNIIIQDNKALCAFYSNEGGIIVSF